jgi:hypothetical protein
MDEVVEEEEDIEEEEDEEEGEDTVIAANRVEVEVNGHVVEGEDMLEVSRNGHNLTISGDAAHQEQVPELSSSSGSSGHNGEMLQGFTAAVEEEEEEDEEVGGDRGDVPVGDVVGAEEVVASRVVDGMVVGEGEVEVAGSIVGNVLVVVAVSEEEGGCIG